jgi:hypothetical protein
MTDQAKGKPTGLGAIFVGLGSGPDLAAEFSLAMLDRLLKEEELSLPGATEGDISAWIKEFFAKPVQFEPHRVSEHQKGVVQREVMRAAGEVFADPRRREEVQMTSRLANISLEDMQRLMTALQQGDLSAFQQVRSDVVKALAQGLGKQMTGEGLATLLALGARYRAGRAAALCMAVFKAHPLSLIAQAEGGSRKAVLQLIKVDKLFLTDGCTAKVIKQAELQNDHSFLAQVARSMRYRVRTNWRQGCRLYLYMLVSLEFLMPNLVKLRLRLDPEGKRFRSEQAFEKFVERTRKEYAGICDGLTDGLEKKHRTCDPPQLEPDG